MPTKEFNLTKLNTFFWNSLPVSIGSACTKSDIKQKLKTFLFNKLKAFS